MKNFGPHARLMGSGKREGQDCQGMQRKRNGQEHDKGMIVYSAPHGRVQGLKMLNFILIHFIIDTFPCLLKRTGEDLYGDAF